MLIPCSPSLSVNASAVHCMLGRWGWLADARVFAGGLSDLLAWHEAAGVGASSLGANTVGYNHKSAIIFLGSREYHDPASGGS